MKYPVYIVSKGRHDRCLTAKALSLMGVDYRIVVESNEFSKYCEFHDTNKLLSLPFSDLGKGSIPARNWVWEDSLTKGHYRHWILDDNIEAFNRLNRNEKFEVHCDSTFRACEDFTDRFSNIGLSGMNYYSFCKSSDSVPPYYLNTRIYSCILVLNSLPFKWRGMYNEDTDLSLRVLKSGLCTVLFNAFLCGKVTTMRMAGGNTDAVYRDTDNRREFAESLKAQHPDVVRITRKFGRWHHHVDYRPFKNNSLEFSNEYNPCHGINEYSMMKIKLMPKTRKLKSGNY